MPVVGKASAGTGRDKRLIKTNGRCQKNASDTKEVGKRVKGKRSARADGPGEFPPFFTSDLLVCSNALGH